MARRACRAATSRGGIHLGDLAGPARGEVVAGQRAVGDGSSRHAQLGRAAVRPAARRVGGGRARTRRARIARSPAGRSDSRPGHDDVVAGAARRGRHAQPPLLLRAVHHRRQQQARPRRRPRGRRAAGRGLQPAVSARAPRPGQNPPPACDRQLRPRLRRRRRSPLRDRRGVHQPVHQRSQLALAAPLQERLPRRRRPVDRRRSVPRQQGQDRGGVLPHFQHPA